MEAFVPMQIILTVTCPLICMSNAMYSSSSRDINPDLVQGIIVVEPDSTNVYNVTELSKIVLQNIGIVTVTVKQHLSVRRKTLKPCQRSELNFTPKCGLSSKSLQIHNSYMKRRAILYIPDLNNKYYIKTPEPGYDKIKVLEEAFTLGVKYIPEECKTLDTLISYFWPANKTNVWQQIFNVIKVLLDERDQQETSIWIESNIKSLRDKLNLLNKKVKGGKYLDPLDDDVKYVLKSKNILDPEKPDSKETMLSFYILPLYSNLITLKVSFITLDMFKIPPDTQSDFESAWKRIIVHIATRPITYIEGMQFRTIDKIYGTVYAGGLYNVMMIAYSHLALHGFDLFPIWTGLYKKKLKIYGPNCNRLRLNATSYSNFYGRATPNLLQQAIHIKKSSLFPHNNNYSVEAELNSIFFNITAGTVCGLKLKFSPEFSTSIGTFGTANNKNVPTLDLSNEKIIRLKVYKTKFIRCLEFTLSDSNTSMFGDCTDNSEQYDTFEFELKDHYIRSLYLANDYTETDIYFDNVAVSFVPNPVKEF